MTNGRSSGLLDKGLGLWKVVICGQYLLVRYHHEGCTRVQNLMILSPMEVREGGGPGVSVVAVGLLADGWSLVGAAPLVVGWDR